MENPDGLVLMGRCGRAHGVRGEVKVIPETDDPDRFRALRRVFVGPSAAEAEGYDVESLRFQPVKGGTAVVLRFAGRPTREDAEALRGLGVYAREADLPPLEEGEVYLHDLVGLRAVEVDDDGAPTGTTLGTVRDVLEGGAQLLLVVAREGRPDVLVPDVPEIVRAVSLGAGEVRIAPPEGLFD